DQLWSSTSVPDASRWLASKIPNTTDKKADTDPIRNRIVVQARNDRLLHESNSNNTATHYTIIGKWTIRGCNRPNNCHSQKGSVFVISMKMLKSKNGRFKK